MKLRRAYTANAPLVCMHSFASALKEQSPFWQERAGHGVSLVVEHAPSGRRVLPSSLGRTKGPAASGFPLHLPICARPSSHWNAKLRNKWRPGWQC